MKKINLLTFCIGFSSLMSISSYAESNIFQPKTEGVSEEDLNEIVQKELAKQRIELQQNFQGEINQLKLEMSNNQTEQIEEIFLQIEELRTENENLKKNQGKIKVKSNHLEPMSNELSEEERASLDAALNAEANVMIITEDILRLNKEFGENSLTFVGIVGEHKMYKNSNGEYIIKNLDFEFDGSQQFENEMPENEIN